MGGFDIRDSGMGFDIGGFGDDVEETVRDVLPPVFHSVPSFLVGVVDWRLVPLGSGVSTHTARVSTSELRASTPASSLEPKRLAGSEKP